MITPGKTCESQGGGTKSFARRLLGKPCRPTGSIYKPGREGGNLPEKPGHPPREGQGRWQPPCSPGGSLDPAGDARHRAPTGRTRAPEPPGQSSGGFPGHAAGAGPSARRSRGWRAFGSVFQLKKRSRSLSKALRVAPVTAHSCADSRLAARSVSCCTSRSPAPGAGPIPRNRIFFPFFFLFFLFFPFSEPSPSALSLSLAGTFLLDALRGGEASSRHPSPAAAGGDGEGGEEQHLRLCPARPQVAGVTLPRWALTVVASWSWHDTRGT